MARRRLQKLGELVVRGGIVYVRYYAGEPDATGKRPRLMHELGDVSMKKLEIERRRRDFMASRDPWLIRPSSNVTFDQFVTQRFAVDIYPTLTPAGKDHYKYILKSHASPAIGALRLRDLHSTHVQGMINAMVGKKLSWQTVEHARVAVGAVIRHAKMMQAWFGDIPTESLRMPPKIVKERRALTWEQVQQITAVSREPVTTMTLVLVLTGLRIGELLGLRWKRVHGGESPHLEIVETYTKCKWKATTKSGKPRRVPLPAWLLPQLMARKTATSSPEDPVFMGKTGRPLNAKNYLQDFLQPAAKLVGIEGIDFHTLRHTFATLTDDLGMTDRQRMALMGHSSMAMTHRYTHPDIEKMAEALKGLPRIQ